MKTAKSRLSTLDMVTIALFAVIIAICAWVSVPSTVPFTLQTLGVMCAMGLLGGKRSVLIILLYLALGCIGLPVFSGFRGGAGMLLGVTGGYLVGFLVAALFYWLWTHLLGELYWVRIAGMVLGLVVCYAFGTAWFMVVYANTTGPIGLSTALAWCVLPFLLPELVKIVLAALLVKIIPTKVKALR